MCLLVLLSGKIFLGDGSLGHSSSPLRKLFPERKKQTNLYNLQYVVNYIMLTFFPTCLDFLDVSEANKSRQQVLIWCDLRHINNLCIDFCTFCLSGKIFLGDGSLGHSYRPPTRIFPKAEQIKKLGKVFDML